MKTETKKSASTVSLASRAETFINAWDRITSDPRTYAALQRKWADALCSWAIMKMGTKRSQYVQEAHRDFAVLCALRLIATNQSLEKVVDEVRYEFPLHLTKKRTGFTESIRDLILIAAEYERVCEVVKLARTNIRSAAQFKLNLREKLLRFAVDEELEPMPEFKLEKLLEHYNLRTLPSQIAVDYVGKRRGISGANIKKLLVVARNPDRMQKSLGKYLKSTYLPANFDAIRASVAG